MFFFIPVALVLLIPGLVGAIGVQRSFRELRDPVLLALPVIPLLCLIPVIAKLDLLVTILSLLAQL